MGSGSSLFNIGAEDFGTMRESLEGLVAHAGTRSVVRSLPMAPTIKAMEWTSALGISPLGAYHSLMYGREMFFDVSAAKEQLGWTSRWSNAAMFADSYDYFVEHREEIMRRRGMSHHRSPLKKGVLALLERIP